MKVIACGNNFGRKNQTLNRGHTPAEYKRHFETERSVAEIKSLPSEPDKFRLTIDGLDDVSWFRRKQNEFMQKNGIKVNQGNSNGMKL